MSIKDMRYNVMLALYFPILLYAFSTFDISEESFVVQGLDPVVMASEETVVLGQPFQAKAFLAVAQTEGQQLSASGSLQAIGDSMFQMTTADLLDEGEDQKTVDYEGRFRFQQVTGEQVEIPVNGRFTVRRPEIVAQSEAAQALYRQSLNQLRIEVPGLENRQLRLQVGDRAVDGRSISLSPAGESVALRVYLPHEEGDDVYLGQKEFAVIDPPRPELRVLNNGREVTTGSTIPKARAALEFQVQPDQEFQRRFTRDARYSIGQATIYLRQGRTASREIGTVDVDNEGQLVLTRLLRDAEAGDQITIVLNGIVRINHAGQAITVPFGRSSRTFGFTLG